MKTKSHARNGLLASLALLMLLLPALIRAENETIHPFAANYRVTFAANWTAASHQGGVPLPGTAHFSPLIGAVHNAEIKFWEPGQLASPGIEDMAELGLTAKLTGEISNEINENPPDALAVISRSGNIDNTATATISSITVNQDFPLITLVSMIAPSHDWFIGVQNLTLWEDGAWVERKVVDLYPYDAGTEEGTDFSLSPSIDTVPQAPISSISGLFPFKSAPLGTFTFTRINYSDLHLKKEAKPNAGVVFHGPVTYTIVLSNSGDVNAAGTTLTDTLPLSTTFANWVEQPAGANVTSDQITWSGNLISGSTLTFTFVVSHTGLAYGETITNLAQFSHPSGNKGQSSASFTVQPAPDIGAKINIYLPVIMR